MADPKQKAVLVDTDVMVDYLRGLPQAVGFIRRFADQIVLSSIVVAELYAGAKGDREETILAEVVMALRVVPVTGEIARAGGLLKRDFGKSHGVGLADALVAATAQQEQAVLATLNVKHFPMIKGLKPAYSKNP